MSYLLKPLTQETLGPVLLRCLERGQGHLLHGGEVPSAMRTYQRWLAATGRPYEDEGKRGRTVFAPTMRFIIPRCAEESCRRRAWWGEDSSLHSE